MSTIEVGILGDGKFSGSVANVSDYSVSESASPLSMTDLQGGVGGITFQVNEDPGFDGSVLLSGQPFEVRDPRAGRQRGVIDEVTITDDFGMNVEASGALLPLVSHRSAQPYSGILSGALIYYFGLCGITSGFQFDTDLALRHVDLPFWEGDVWNQIKKLQAIHQFEIADVAGSIIVRKLRLRKVEVRKNATSRLSYTRDGASQIVEVVYYKNSHEVNKQVYPNPETSIVDRPIISVNAGETTTTNYRVPMWIESIDEPTQVSSLPWDNTSVTSVYAVVDKDGAPVTVGDWSNGGGLVSFAIGADGRSVDVTVRGMITQDRAPYRIASSSEDQEYQYAALYIAATGVAFEEDNVLWAHTGADIVDAPSDSITRIDDPMVSTIQDAAIVLANAVFDNNGFSQRLEVTATAVNRRGETGQQASITFGQWDAEHPTTTFGQFDALYPTTTFGQYDIILSEPTEDDFSNQAFGSVGGARLRHRDNMYRIRSASSRPGLFNWTAEDDLVFSEWDSGHAGLTFGQFDSTWTGKTFEQHARMPLVDSGAWSERRQNRSVSPQPNTFAGSNWGANLDFRNIPQPGWVGGTLSATDTPYIFVAMSNRAYAAGEQVTLSLRYRVTALDAGPRYITTLPHVRTGNVYYRGGYQQTRIVTVGQDEDVVIQWVTPVAIGANQLDIAILVTDFTSNTVHAAAAGFGMRATRSHIEDGWTSGEFFDGSTDPNGFPVRTRWLSTPGYSGSVLERFIPQVG